MMKFTLEFIPIRTGLGSVPVTGMIRAQKSARLINFGCMKKLLVMLTQVLLLLKDATADRVSRS